ncbi:LOW QUALITY PROTEIN: hypothetical protein PHAVU_004G151000, partial [Phaseolus vulgaris]
LTYLFCIEAIYKAQAETGEINKHYLNAIVVVFARELGVPIVIHDYLIGRFTANTSLTHYCRDNGLLLHIHRAMHAIIDSQKNHGIHFRVLAKALHLSEVLLKDNKTIIPYVITNISTHKKL